MLSKKNKLLKFILINLGILILFGSCTNRTYGLYTSEVKSEVKYIQSSVIELKNKEKFVLKSSTTSFETNIPSASISELHGKFKKNKEEIILIPEQKRVSWIQYTKNESAGKSVGARKSAYIAKDTLVGNFQKVTKKDSLIFTLVKMQNSYYLRNNQNCFVKYIKQDTKNDLKNYCNELDK